VRRELRARPTQPPTSAAPANCTPRQTRDARKEKTVSEGLPLLAVRINQARQLTQKLRGPVLKPETADKIATALREIQRLLGGKEVYSSNEKTKTGKPTRRRTLWRRDPHCFWCGRLTVFEAFNSDDAATLEHIYHRNHPRRRDARRHLPGTVLACRRCNSERGSPEVTTGEECPVIVAERRRAAA
jgi:hypothetical protein